MSVSSDLVSWVSIVAVLLLLSGATWWRWTSPLPPALPPTTVPTRAPVVSVAPKGVWVVLMDASERDVIVSEYVPLFKRPFKVTYEGQEYLVARGSVGEGYFIYRQVSHAPA